MVDHGERDADVGLALQELLGRSSVRCGGGAVLPVGIVPGGEGEGGLPHDGRHVLCLIEGRDPALVRGLCLI